MKKEWAEICGEAYTPSAVTDKHKIHGFEASGEAPPTGGRCGRRQVTRGGPYAEESEVGADLRGDTGVIGFWDPPRMFVFNV